MGGGFVEKKSRCEKELEGVTRLLEGSSLGNPEATFVCRLGNRRKKREVILHCKELGDHLLKRKSRIKRNRYAGEGGGAERNGVRGRGIEGGSERGELCS